MQEFFSVGKRISLYLSRVSPQQAIDHLVHEVSMHLNDENISLSTPVAMSEDPPPDFIDLLMNNIPVPGEV